jgi:hypothetical protein
LLRRCVWPEQLALPLRGELAHALQRVSDPDRVPDHQPDVDPHVAGLTLHAPHLEVRALALAEAHGQHAIHAPDGYLGRDRA